MAVFYSFELLKTINPKLRTFIKFVEMDLQFLDVSLLKCKIWFKHAHLSITLNSNSSESSRIQSRIEKFSKSRYKLNEVKTAIYI